MRRPATAERIADVIAQAMGCRIAVCDPADCPCRKAARTLARSLSTPRPAVARNDPKDHPD